MDYNAVVAALLAVFRRQHTTQSNWCVVLMCN